MIANDLVARNEETRYQKILKKKAETMLIMWFLLF